MIYVIILILILILNGSYVIWLNFKLVQYVYMLNINILMRWWWVCDVYWLGKGGVKVRGGGWFVAIQG